MRTRCDIVPIRILDAENVSERIIVVLCYKSIARAADLSDIALQVEHIIILCRARAVVVVVYSIRRSVLVVHEHQPLIYSPLVLYYLLDLELNYPKGWRSNERHPFYNLFF